MISQLLDHKSFSEQPGFRGQHVNAQCNLQTNKPGPGYSHQGKYCCAHLSRRASDGQCCLNVHFTKADGLSVEDYYASSYCCIMCLGLLFATGTPMINSVTHSATWKHHGQEDYSQGCRPGGWRPRVGDG